MAKATIATIKRNLATEFPDVVFTYGMAGRGRQRGRSVEWVGGPFAVDVRMRANVGWNQTYHFVRQSTDAEIAVQAAEWEAGEPARIEARAADKAERKAAGKLKSAMTREWCKKLRAALGVAFPGVHFTVRASPRKWTDVPAVDWTDGPKPEMVRLAIGRAGLTAEFNHTESTEVRTARVGMEMAHKASTTHTARLAHRLSASIARRAVVAHAMRRRAFSGVQLELFEWRQAA